MDKGTITRFKVVERIAEYEKEVSSVWDSKRLDYCKQLLADDIARVANGKNHDSGLYGKVAEVFSRDSDSRKINIARQNRPDCRPVIDGTRRKCEYKSNGGRIGAFKYKRNKDTTYMVYEMFWIGQLKKDGTREIRQLRKIMNVATFLYILNECNATKTVRHKDYVYDDSELAIQVSNKPMYEMMRMLTDYERNKAYCSKNIVSLV